MKLSRQCFLEFRKKRNMRIMFLYTFLFFVDKFKKRVCCYTLNEVTCFWSLCGFWTFQFRLFKVSHYLCVPGEIESKTFFVHEKSKVLHIEKCNLKYSMKPLWKYVLWYKIINPCPRSILDKAIAYHLNNIEFG